jgi:hypothetical protein
MQVRIEGKKLVIELDLEEPRPSKQGKSLIVASSGGFAPTTVQVKGKPVKVSVNAIIAS